MSAKIAKQRVMACIDHDAARAKIVDKRPNVHSRSTGPSGPKKGN